MKKQHYFQSQTTEDSEHLGSIHDHASVKTQKNNQLMKINLMKHLRLTLTGLVMAAASQIASAQTANISFTFNTAIPTWTFWYNAPAVTFAWSANDAATNPASGSLAFTTAGSSQEIFYSGFNADGSANPVNLNNYATEEFDLYVDPNLSTPNAWGDYGTLEVRVRNDSGNSQIIGQVTIPANASANWVHFSVPIPANLGTWAELAFGFEDWVGSPSNPNGWHLNNTTATYYLDNLTIVAKPPAPSIVGQPVGQELFAGKTANWNVSVSGGQPLSYQWYKGTTALTDLTNLSGSIVTGSSSNVFSIANVSAADIANYKLLITNSFGSVTSSVVNLSIVSPAGAEAIATAALNPVAFYELNETNNPATTSPAYDHVGGFAGTYSQNSSNWFDGVFGPEGSGFPGFTGINGAAGLVANSGAYITLPPLNLNTNMVTFTAWIKPKSYVGNAPILMSRYASTASGFVWADGNGDLGFNWANNSATWGWNTSGVRPPLNQWSFVALVITPNDATVYSFSAAGISTPGNLVVGNGNQAFEGPTLIGSDAGSANRTYDGAIDDVAIYNYSLTTDQLQQLYFAGAGGPTLRFDGVNLSWDDLSTSPIYPSATTTTLLEASNLTGPWTTVAGSTSPWPVTPVGSQHYYRLQVQ